jgi:hypothetical protein
MDLSDCRCRIPMCPLVALMAIACIALMVPVGCETDEHPMGRSTFEIWMLQGGGVSCTNAEPVSRICYCRLESPDSDAILMERLVNDSGWCEFFESRIAPEYVEQLRRYIDEVDLWDLPQSDTVPYFDYRSALSLRAKSGNKFWRTHNSTGPSYGPRIPVLPLEEARFHGVLNRAVKFFGVVRDRTRINSERFHAISGYASLDCLWRVIGSAVKSTSRDATSEVDSLRGSRTFDRLPIVAPK